MTQNPRGWAADGMLIGGTLSIIAALYAGVGGVSREVWTILLVGGFIVLAVGAWRPYRWHLTLWQMRHPRKAWWMWRVGHKLAAAYEMRQATDDREAEAKRQRETHRWERLAIEATVHQQYGDAVSIFDCPVCGAFIVDPPTVFQPGELCKPIEAPLSYLHVRSHGCTCPPGISGLCPYCSAGARFGWIAYNFDTEEGEGHVGTD